MPQIFISYRREDAGYVAGMISQRLQSAFGAGSVFIDIDNIPLGVDFRKHLSEAVAKCDILLAVIGDDWPGSVAGSPLRRIDEPTDFVRIEVEAALARDIPVVPVLVGKALLPAPAALPEGLRPLAFRNAAEVRSGRDLNAHLDALLRGLRAHFGDDTKPQQTKPVATSPPQTPEPPRAVTAAEPGRPSYFKAVLWHLCFGRGLHYLRSPLPVRALYMVSAILLAGTSILGTFIRVHSDVLAFTFLFSFLAYILSFIHVIFLCRQQRRSASLS